MILWNRNPKAHSNGSYIKQTALFLFLSFKYPETFLIHSLVNSQTLLAALWIIPFSNANPIIRYAVFFGVEFLNTYKYEIRPKQWSRMQTF